jgi:hypothetical protein
MFRTLKMIFAVASVLAFVAGTAMAQGFRDAGAKAQGQFGTGFYSNMGRAMTTYRAPMGYAAPQVVRTVPAPLAVPAAPRVAQAPTTTRSFSVEPSQTATPRTAIVPEVTRSYSVEPAARVYGPQPRRTANVPTYLLPKTDSRKFGG